jgi:hypothetical protein
MPCGLAAEGYSESSLGACNLGEKVRMMTAQNGAKKELLFLPCGGGLVFCGCLRFAVISSMGFGGGVVAIVQPIHAPMQTFPAESINEGMSRK